MKFNESSYFPLSLVCKSAPRGWMFGPTTFKKEKDCIYPDKVITLNSTVMWNPTLHKTISLQSYFDAQENHDEEALAKIKSFGIPLGIDFGIS